MRHLTNAGLTAIIVSRRPFDVPAGFTKQIIDMNNLGAWTPPKNAIVLSTLPIWVLPDFLPRFTDAKAIIATSSTSRFSKSSSSDTHERDISEKLTTAEDALQKWAVQNNVPWTILRPTLIYDCKTDRNITRMAQFIRRWHFLPIAIPSNGLRQPIHTDDVAKAVFKCIDNPAIANKAFNISGSEILSYRAMAERVFEAVGIKPRFLPLPVPLLKIIFKTASALGVIKESSFGAHIFQRMNEDLVFETATGVAAINYQPRPFKPTFT